MRWTQWKGREPYNNVDCQRRSAHYEEAHVFVHDLNQFVTVQLLLDTPAVLTPGNLWEDHGYSCECWSAVKSHDWPQMGILWPARQTTSYLLSFQGYPPILGGVRLLHRPQDSSSSSASPVSERSDGQAPGNWCRPTPKTQNQKKKRDDRENSDDPLANIRDWLTEFKENLVEELPARAHSFRESDLELCVEVTWKLRKHSIYTHIRKDRKCDVCWGPTLQGIHVEDSLAKLPLRAGKFGELITADHKVLNEGCESRDNHWYAVVVQDLATQWIQSYPCKTKSSHETEKKLIKIFGAVTRTESCLFRQLDEIWESMWRFIMESQHFNTSSIRDTWHRWKSRSPSQRRHISSIATVRSGWKVVVWLFGMLLPSAKHPRPLGRREDAIWKTIWRTIQRTNHTLWSNDWVSSYFTERSEKNSSIWQERITRNELVARWIWKWEILIVDLEDLEKLDASDVCLRRIFAKEMLIRQKGDECIFPIADCTAKLAGGDYEFREPALRQESTVQIENLSGENSRRIGRVSTVRTNRWRWSTCRLLVRPRWLCLSSSQWTLSSTLHAEGRNIPNSTGIHWRY